MTKDEKILKAYERYLDKIKRLDEEYEERFNELPVNEYGEVVADGVLALNQWHTQTRKEINKDFADEVKNM